ncbi:MAG: hypothetical protein EPN85_09535 [Bacteroidetes bacterium]|nr:MAG: hypothetical protein EPN85_09535 [Bacteroidota bacterium]
MLFTSFSFSQSLDKIGKKDMIKTGGGLNFSSVLYGAQGIPDRRQPFTWFLNGNLTTSIADISLPFIFNYSNNQISYTQPYMLQSFNPTYKWIKGYAGITSINFSQYTLAGHVFSGAGVELTPKNLKFSAMYGRLKKAVEYDVMNSSDLTMSYKRIGFGASAGYEKNGNGLNLIFFTSEDDPNSLTFFPINTTVTPMQNTVISISGKTSLYKKLKVETEYALSGLTRSLSSPEEISTVPKNRLPHIFKPNATSQFFDAFKSSIGYNYKLLDISLIYERVDPGYRTLGAYYFNNDLENITISPVLNLLKGKLNLSCNTGVQHNNLDHSKLSTSKRWVGSLSANYVPDKFWSFTGSYSNFSTFTRQRPQSDPFYQNTVDTLNFYQLSQNSSLSAGCNFGKPANKQAMLLSINYLVTGQDQGMISDPGILNFVSNSPLPAKVINGNLGHTISITKIKTTISSSINGNYSHLTGMNTFYFGPNLNLSRSLANKTLRITIGSSYNQVLTNSEKSNEIVNHRIAANYSPKFFNAKIGKIAMNVSASYLQKLGTNTVDNSFSEFTGNFGINYSF